MPSDLRVDVRIDRDMSGHDTVDVDSSFCKMRSKRGRGTS